LLSAFFFVLWTISNNLFFGDFAMNNLKCSKGSQIRRGKENRKLKNLMNEAASLDPEAREQKSDVIQLTVEELERLRSS
jgi:hypothetical protein